MFARVLAGEPYDDASAARAIRAGNFRSAYQVPPDRPPAPLLLHSGFTDDLFPVDEVLRFANRTEKKFPKLPVSLVLGDLGHQRSSNKADVRKHMLHATQRFFDDQLRGRGPGVRRGVVAYTQTCPRDAPSGGPFRARRFTELARDRVTYESKPERTITSLSGDPLVGRAIDPVTGGGNACAKTPAADGWGAAVYRLPAVRAGGASTLLGAPSVRARLHVTGVAPENAQVNARLWDERPDGTQTLVARGPLRPRGGGGAQRWELHANGWRFAPGHVPRLELVGNDLPFMRPSNGLFSVQITDLELVLPVR
jgi:predicted acyl esterase